MSEPIRFSVVIPAYNAAATIVGSVRSVLDQSVPPYEVIIVDDGSTDEMATLVASHFAESVIFINLGKNLGPAGARNAGIDRARGDYIAFQDADDIWHPEKLKILGQVLRSRPDVRFLFHPFTHGTFPQQSFDVLPGVVRLPYARLLLSNPIGTPCAVLQRHPGLRFDAAMHHMEDYDLFLREAYRTPVYCLPLPLTRLGRPVLAAGGQSSNRWKMRKGELRAYAHLGRLNPLFYLLLPLLGGWSLGKHLFKNIRKRNISGNQSHQSTT